MKTLESSTRSKHRTVLVFFQEIPRKIFPSEWRILVIRKGTSFCLLTGLSQGMETKDETLVNSVLEQTGMSQIGFCGLSGSDKSDDNYNALYFAYTAVNCLAPEEKRRGIDRGQEVEVCLLKIPDFLAQMSDTDRPYVLKAISEMKFSNESFRRYCRWHVKELK